MGKIEEITITEGSQVGYNGSNYIIQRILNFNTVVLNPSDGIGNLIKAGISDLRPSYSEKGSDQNKKDIDVSLIPEKDWEIAQKRHAIVSPIIENKLSTEEIKQIAKDSKIHIATLYRWIARFQKTNQMSSLVPSDKDGGRGGSRISKELELIIKTTIEDEYLTKQKKTIQKVCDEVAIRCHNAKIDPPSSGTIRRRVEALSNEYKMRHRHGKDETQKKYEPLRAKYREAKVPLQIVQIDHTPLDIILVDEVNREAMQRPHLTLAFDVYSRMVVGLYISFDTPGALGTGMCLANAILPKDMLLARMDVQGEWPCWGVMKTIHADNAKEFRGNSLKRVAEEYGINLEWREVGKPKWGGHIEKYLGTLNHEIQTLPGTTFSNTHQRQKYDSEGKASLTLKELEKWVVTYIINVYHKRFHSGINTSPIAKFNEGVFGSPTQKGVGIPKRIFNERKVKLDFMPYVERSIQDYGVQIDHIYYYDDKLRPYINALEQNQRKSKQKRKFVFKRDPRDISVIYFYDPESKQYYEIPYRDPTHPPITIWEYRAVERALKEQGKKEIDERAIFEGYAQMKAIEKAAVDLTSKTRRIKKETKRKHSMSKSLKNELAEEKKAREPIKVVEEIEVKNIKPFDDIDV